MSQWPELKKQFDYFISHQAELVEKYNGKRIVMVGEKVVGAFDALMDAYTFARGKYAPGTFMIQLCIPGEEAYTATVSTPGLFLS